MRKRRRKNGEDCRARFNNRYTRAVWKYIEPRAGEYVEKIEYDERVRQLISRLPDEVKGFARQVGAWLWVELPERVPGVDGVIVNFKPSIQRKLKKLGFFWNPRRRAWQNPVGVESARAKFDPRKKYPVLDLFRNAPRRLTPDAVIYEPRKDEEPPDDAPF